MFTSITLNSSCLQGLIRIIHLAEINGKILKLKQRTILLIIG